jgi:hypothetical protein
VKVAIAISSKLCLIIGGNPARPFLPLVVCYPASKVSFLAASAVEESFGF